MIDHLELSTRDPAASTAFYRRALAALGYTVQVDGPPLVGFGPEPGRVGFWLRQGEVGATRPHFAFACPTRASVDACHRAGLDAGGTDNGAPKLRTDLAPDYYVAFVLDPDGHNVEFVCRG